VALATIFAWPESVAVSIWDVLEVMDLATSYEIFATLRANISWLWAAVNDEFSKNGICLITAA
jgi:hypothetical protein